MANFNPIDQEYDCQVKKESKLPVFEKSHYNNKQTKRTYRNTGGWGGGWKFCGMVQSPLKQTDKLGNKKWPSHNMVQCCLSWRAFALWAGGCWFDPWLCHTKYVIKMVADASMQSLAYKERSDWSLPSQTPFFF